MQIPAILQVESLTRLMQGVAIGAVATIFVGFSLGGWVTGGTARKMAQRDIGDATITALVPICAEKFQNHADAVMNLTTLKKIGLWQQAFFSEKGGWATMPGAPSSNFGVAQACAEMLGNPKVVNQK